MKNTMNEMLLKYVAGLISINVCAMAMAGCTANLTENTDSGMSLTAVSTAVDTTDTIDTVNTDDTTETVTASLNTSVSGGLYSADELFTDRDLTQTADLSGATYYTVKDGKDITITEAGVYVLSGTASDVTVTVNAGSDDKVQLVLDGVSITNADSPCIYVRQADKVFVTTTDSGNSLSVTGTFTADGDTNTDGVIFSKDDLVLNGTGTLTVSSTDNGVVCKDDLRITGGTYNVTASSKAFEANDSIRIAGGSFTVTAGTDGFHAENDDDNTLGYIYIVGGQFTVKAGDDGVHATTVAQIDGGSLAISAAEGIEATYIQINGGTVNIESWDDGINAARKSSAYTPTVEITGGDITITMGAGDTDGVDSNGNIIITGGTVNVTGQSSFDYDGTATFTGGTVIVNGQQVDTLPNQMMGGGMGGRGMGGRGGRR